QRIIRRGFGDGWPGGDFGHRGGKAHSFYFRAWPPDPGIEALAGRKEAIRRASIPVMRPDTYSISWFPGGSGGSGGWTMLSSWAEAMLSRKRAKTLPARRSSSRATSG